jgi:hypothetical protein
MSDLAEEYPDNKQRAGVCYTQWRETEMNEFKGFDDWIAVFKTGVHTDSKGRTRNWTDADLEEIINGYKPKEHEAPVVIGHPKEDSPAYGWVERLKKEGSTLLAKFRQVAPEFADMVKKGLFKKRSISLTPDLRLRHIGFLGATPPAIKGLPDVAFKEEKDEITLEYAAEEHKQQTKKKDGGITMLDQLKEFIEAMKFWKEAQAEFVAPKPDDKDKDETLFTEADLDKAKAEAALEERKKAEAEFAEGERKKAEETRGQEIKTWLDQGVKDGKIAPAWVKLGLQQFVEGLDAEAEIEFAEDKKSSTYQWFMDFMAALPKLIEMKELATRDKDAGSGNAGEKIEALIAEKQKANKDLGYSAAFAEVQLEHPDLVVEYQSDMQ